MFAPISKFVPEGDIRGTYLANSIIEGLDMRGVKGLVLFQCSLIDTQVADDAVNIAPLPTTLEGLAEHFNNAIQSTRIFRNNALVGGWVYGADLSRVVNITRVIRDMEVVSCEVSSTRSGVAFNLFTSVFEDCDLNIPHAYELNMKGCSFENTKITAGIPDASEGEVGPTLSILGRSRFESCDLNLYNTKVNLSGRMIFQNCTINLAHSRLSNDRNPDHPLWILKCHFEGDVRDLDLAVVRTTSKWLWDRLGTYSQESSIYFGPDTELHYVTISESIDLSDVSFEGSLIAGTDFGEDVNLQGADFSRCVILDSTFLTRHLEGVKFTGSLLDAETIDSLPKEGSYPGAHALVSYSNFEGADVNVLDLMGIDLKHCVFKGLRVRTRFLLWSCDLRGSDFKGIILPTEGAVLQKCDIRGCDFSGVEGISFTDCMYNKTTKVPSEKLTELEKWNNYWINPPPEIAPNALYQFFERWGKFLEYPFSAVRASIAGSLPPGYAAPQEYFKISTQEEFEDIYTVFQKTPNYEDDSTHRDVFWGLMEFVDFRVPDLRAMLSRSLNNLTYADEMYGVRFIDVDAFRGLARNPTFKYVAKPLLRFEDDLRDHAFSFDRSILEELCVEESDFKVVSRALKRSLEDED